MEIVEEVFGKRSEEKTAHNKFNDYWYQYENKIKKLSEKFLKG